MRSPYGRGETRHRLRRPRSTRVSLMPRGAGTIRERLIKHQNVATCAECHSKIAPPEFALETFNPIGEFRGFYQDDKGKNALEIDTRVTLHNGESAADLCELRSTLRQTRSDQFLLGLSRKALTYPLGRELTLRDRPSPDHIIEATINSGYGFQDLILAVVSSEVYNGELGPPTFIADR